MPLTEEEAREKEILELEIEIEEQEALENNSLNSSPDAKINLQKRPDSDSWLKDTSDYISDYGVTDEIVNAATFGLSPRFRAGGKTVADIVGGLATGKGMPDISDTYGKNLDQQFKQRDRYRKEHPYMSTIGGVAGAFVNPVSKAVGNWMSGGRLANTVPRNINPTTAQLMRRGVIGGGGMAGLQGFNEADGSYINRLKEAVPSFGMGAGIGAGLPPAIKGGAYVLKQLATGLSKIPFAVDVGGRMPLGSGMQETVAWRKIDEALRRDGHTVESAIRRLEELGPEATVADLGDNMRNLAYSVYSRPSEGSAKVFRTAERRQKGFFPMMIHLQLCKVGNETGLPKKQMNYSQRNTLAKLGNLKLPNSITMPIRKTKTFSPINWMNLLKGQQAKGLLSKRLKICKMKVTMLLLMMSN